MSRRLGACPVRGGHGNNRSPYMGEKKKMENASAEAKPLKR